MLYKTCVINCIFAIRIWCKFAGYNNNVLVKLLLTVFRDSEVTTISRKKVISYIPIFFSPTFLIPFSPKPLAALTFERNSVSLCACTYTVLFPAFRFTSRCTSLSSLNLHTRHQLTSLDVTKYEIYVNYYSFQRKREKEKREGKRVEKWQVERVILLFTVVRLNMC